jgi:hypothetical protein
VAVGAAAAGPAGAVLRPAQGRSPGVPPSTLRICPVRRPGEDRHVQAGGKAAAGCGKTAATPQPDNAVPARGTIWFHQKVRFQRVRTLLWVRSPRSHVSYPGKPKPLTNLIRYPV